MCQGPVQWQLKVPHVGGGGVKGWALVLHVDETAKGHMALPKLFFFMAMHKLCVIQTSVTLPSWLLIYWSLRV